MFNKKIVLSINTSDREKTVVSLQIGDKKFSKEKPSENNTSQTLLPLIEEILNEHSLSIKDITEIKVAEGPGSFTGLRVGVTVASALGWFLGIPVNGKKGKIIEPKYS